MAFVIPSLEPGGAERVLSIMANHWAAVGHEITILLFAQRRPPPFFELDPAVECRFLAISAESPNIFRAVRNNLRRLLVLRAALSETKPEVILSFLTETNVLTLLAARFLGVPVIVAEHTDPFRCPLPRAWSALRDITYRWAKKIVVLTADAGTFFDQKLQRKIKVVPNPIVVSRGEAGPENTAERENIILAVGRLSAEKGFDLLLRAISMCLPEMRSWRLIIIGEGPERRKLEQLAETLGIADLVRFNGLAPDPGLFYQRAGVFVLSSRFEGFPMGLCEAMAYGCPVIATEYNPSVFEIIDPGENGLVVRSGDTEELSSALRVLIADAPLRARLGSAAKGITKKYGVKQVMGIWDSLVAPSERNKSEACVKHG